MNKRTKAAVLLIILAVSVASLALWLSSPSPSVSGAEQSQDKSMEDVAAEYADKNSTFEQVLKDIDSLAQSQNLTAEETDWLKARVAELRNAASYQEPPEQPETFEDYTQYFANYDSQVLNDIKTAQKLYDQYSRNPGPDAPVTQSILQALNQAKLKENSNLMVIDSEINQLILNGTLTNEQGALLRERVHQLRTP